MVEIISIRENNDFCYNAMLHGQDMKRQIVTKTAIDEKIEYTKDQEKANDKQVLDAIKRG